MSESSPILHCAFIFMLYEETYYIHILYNECSVEALHQDIPLHTRNGNYLVCNHDSDT